jgi:hypothetical protein
VREITGKVYLPGGCLPPAEREHAPARVWLVGESYGSALATHYALQGVRDTPSRGPEVETGGRGRTGGGCR